MVLNRITIPKNKASDRYHIEPVNNVMASRLRRYSSTWLVLLCLLVGIGRLQAKDSSQKLKGPSNSKSSEDIFGKSLEQLMNVSITSVSRRKEKLSRTPAAIFVITQEDIRRSGATSIPGLLRMVPGVDVARIIGDRWAISIRGFNDVYSSKLLVLVDGRTVYTPGFSGVYWNQLDVPLDDIERIEVIRGPGGTAWGANAVNGVINIITKNSKETQGTTLKAAAGSEKGVMSDLQNGGKLGKNGYYRVFARYFDYGGQNTASGEEAADGWLMRHAGFRTDWDLSHGNTLMMEGDLYQTNAGEPVHQLFTNQGFISRSFTSLVDTSGGSILGRWDHHFSGGSHTTLQFYDNGYTLSNQGVRERLNSFDLEFLHHVTLGSRHNIVWGLEYRRNHFSIGAGYSVAMSPPVQNFSLFSGFFQDQIRLTDSLWFTLGSKIEHNAFTGVETDPSASLTWAINNRQTLWASVAKAVRTPSMVEESFRVDVASFPLAGGGLGVYTIFGNRNFQSEQLRDYEVGYRVQAARNVSLDLATFYSFYHNLVTLEPGTPFFEALPPPPHIEFPSVWGNGMHAQDYGAEAAIDWEPFRRWKLRGGYSWLKMNLHLDPNSHDRSSMAAERESPAHQFNIRSYLDITKKWSLDNSLYYVSSLPGFQLSSYEPAIHVPSYLRLDARLAWRIHKSLEASVVGQNLLRPRHFEFGDIHQFMATQLERSVFGEVRWSF